MQTPYATLLQSGASGGLHAADCDLAVLKTAARNR
jgi:hypothetical protein